MMVKDHLIRGKFKVVKIFDDGTHGANEVAHLRLTNGVEIVQKVMLGVKIYHQRRKALTEAVMYLLDRNIGPEYVVPEIYVELFKLYPSYTKIWGERNVEGHERICQVVRGYAPKWSGEEWRGSLYAAIGNLEEVDKRIKEKISTSPTAEKISVLDFLTVNQDRSARNWATDGEKFYAIDNGMAWFHEFPEGDWRSGCVIDNVLLQVGKWRFISGVFTTLWAGRKLSGLLLNQMKNFYRNKVPFLEQVEANSLKLGFPPGMCEDWRFIGILRRLDWMVKKGRQPTAKEYRKWRKDSDLMTPERIVALGGKVKWRKSWDIDRKVKQHLKGTINSLIVILMNC